MALFVLGDTHLSLGGSKPMDVFPGWNGYVERLERNWRKLIKPEDTIVLAGDISWAMRLTDTRKDFAFSQQLQKAVNQLAKRTRHYLAVPVDGGMRRLDAATIYYIESEGHRVHFYTEDGDFSAPGALKALEEKLTGRLFARCNSGYLVNLAQVSGVQQNTVQVGPHELQISRPKRRAFLAALADYIGGEGA